MKAIEGDLKALTKLIAVIALCTVVSQAQRGAAAGSALPGPIVYNNGAQSEELNGIQLFQDTFSTGLDTNYRWTCTNGGGGVAATNTVGATVLSSGTTLNGFSKCISQDTFIPPEPGLSQGILRINIETPVLTTGHRFWGFGTSPASPTIANPITNAVGFEIGLDGHFDCVTYASGTRLLVKDLFVSSQTPVNYNTSYGGPFSSHGYIIRANGGAATYYVDQVNPVNGAINAVPTCNWSSGAGGPDVNELPLLVQAISNGSTAVTIQLNAAIEADTGRNEFIPLKSNFRDHSGTVTVGGTSQTVFPVNTSRKRIIIENYCTATTQGIATAESIFVNFTSAASTTVAGSIEITNCGSYDSGSGPVSSELVTITSATSAHKFAAKEQ